MNLGLTSLDRKIIISLVMVTYCIAGNAGGVDKKRSWAEDYYGQVKSEARKKYSPTGGMVADENTAIAIAVAVWKPIYGDEHIEKQKPWHAFLIDNHWVVLGSLSEGHRGGVAHAIISRPTGEIVDVTHTQ